MFGCTYVALAGLQAARARGRLGGRRTVITAEKVRVAREMLLDGRYTMQQIAETIGISRATLYRHLAPAGSTGHATHPPDPLELAQKPGAKSAREARRLRRPDLPLALE